MFIIPLLSVVQAMAAHPLEVRRVEYSGPGFTYVSIFTIIGSGWGWVLAAVYR